MIKIGEAAFDERTALAYGEPGDQTGLEVRISEFYDRTDKPWERVLRCKNEDQRKAIADAMYQACTNENIGYAQYGDGSTPYKDRYGLYYALEQTASHMIKDVIIPCNVDCSALVAQCCRSAGIDIPVTIRTATQRGIFANTGAFDDIQYIQGMELKQGDIMWRNGHTAAITSVDEHSKVPKWVGKITKYCNVYALASSDSALLKEWPHLGKDNLIDVCDEDGKFYYVRIAGKYFGFVEKAYVINAAPAPEPVPPIPVKFPMVGTMLVEAVIRTGPSADCVTCLVDANDGKGMRDTLARKEEVTAVYELNGWYQLKIVGKSYTWYPWVEAKHVKEGTERKPQEGDHVQFVGQYLYTSAYGGKATAVPEFKGIVDKIYSGRKHPYHVKADNNQYSGYADGVDLEVI